MKKNTHEIDIRKVSHTFVENEHKYKRLKEEVFFTLEEELNKTDIKIHSIPSRIKKLDSFLDKINRYRIENPFVEIDDIVGLRVICLFLTDIEKIGTVIRENFNVIKEDNKIDNSKFASFGYLSVHFIAKLGKNFKGTRYDKIIDIPFEIQVRTIAMDAWANISHYLDYKTDKDIPEELKRDFYALSGMFYVADKHFQMFFEQRKENDEEIQETDIKSQPINLDTLKVFLREKFPNIKPAPILSDLVKTLSDSGFQTIGEIDSIVEKNRVVAKVYFEKNKALSSRALDISYLSVILYISNYKFYLAFTESSESSVSEALWKTTFKDYTDLVKK